jgi:hypothetical protein
MQKCEHEHYSCIFRVSFLSFLSSIYALYCGVYDLAIVPGGVFLTSVNYWRYPIHGWRRNLDMGYVASALIYQNYRAYYMATEGHDYILLYYALMFFSIGCYPVSLHLHKKKDLRGSTYVHCLLHVVANIANLVLYSGGGGVGGVRNRNPPSGSAAPFCPTSDAPFFR